MAKQKSSFYYSLGDMLEIFKDHSNKNEKQMKKDRKDFPDADWTKDQFNISKALYSICHEIDQLKNDRNI
jgi:hypothetical protein